MPAVVLRNRDELRPRAGAIHAHALCVRAKMTPPRQAIATMSTGDVPLARRRDRPWQILSRDHLDSVDNADELVADDHRHRNRFLCPLVPFIDMQVRAADRRFQNANEHIVAT